MVCHTRIVLVRASVEAVQAVVEHAGERELETPLAGLDRGWEKRARSSSACTTTLPPHDHAVGALGGDRLDHQLRGVQNDPVTGVQAAMTSSPRNVAASRSGSSRRSYRLERRTSGAGIPSHDDADAVGRGPDHRTASEIQSSARLSSGSKGERQPLSQMPGQDTIGDRVDTLDISLS
jgi:hypothetical protein